MSSAVKYGVIIGIIGVVITGILYAMGPEAMGGPLSWVSILISLGLYIYFGIQARKDNGGFFTFGEAFKSVFIMVMVSYVINLVFIALLYTVIDPSLGDSMKEIAIENATGIYEGMGMSQEQIDIAMEEMEKQDMSPVAPMNLAIGLAMYLFGGAIFAAIMGAVLKREDPETAGY